MSAANSAGVVDWEYSIASPSSLSLDLLQSPSSSHDGKLPAVKSTQNPISSRLYKILGTTYSDNTTRDALLTLSNIYSLSTVASEHGESAKSNGADVHDSDENTQSAGPSNTSKAGPSSSAGIAARARKHLRKDVEVKMSQSSQAFLKAFKAVDEEKLDDLEVHVDSMRTKCDEAATQLEATNAACNLLLDRAGGLRTLRHAVIDRQTVVNAFLKCFTLAAEESDILSSREKPVNGDFFRAMKRAEKIREDCRLLMSGDDGPTKSGMDVMTMTSQMLEKGFDNLARWCATEINYLARESQLEVSSTMQNAVRWLKKRPELLTDALSALSQIRQATILNSFLTALTRGGPNGLPRPIEIHAHDPMRYVGDIMAWVHQAVASERESLEGLFSRKDDGRMVGSIRILEGDEEEEWMQQLMNNVFEKLCSPLKARVRITIRSQDSSVLAFKLANMLQFYKVTMSRTIGETATLSLVLTEITEEAYKTFTDLLHAQAQMLTQTTAPDILDAEPPSVVKDYMQSLKELMAVYDTSLMGDENGSQQRPDFQPVIQTVINAALDLCSKASEKYIESSWNKLVFRINCLGYLFSEVGPYNFAAPQAKLLEDEINICREELTDIHVTNLLEDTRLGGCISACDNNSHNEPISRIGIMQPNQLLQALSQFAEWLSSTEVVRSHRLSLLTDQKLENKIHQTALRHVTDAYERICEEVRRPENKYEAGNTLLGNQRPFGQISTLRQILGLSGE